MPVDRSIGRVVRVFFRSLLFGLKLEGQKQINPCENKCKQKAYNCFEEGTFTFQLIQQSQAAFRVVALPAVSLQVNAAQQLRQRFRVLATLL